MLEIGIISDTHGKLSPQELLAAFEGAQLILHAGDVGHHGKGQEEVLKGLYDVAEHCRSPPVTQTAASYNTDLHSITLTSLEKVEELPAVVAVQGNTDDVGQPLPEYVVLHLLGWRVLMLHHVGKVPEQVVDFATQLIRQHNPHIVISGHSHISSVTMASDGILYINPGSAGPARFKLGRSVARLCLPPREEGSEPDIRILSLATKAPFVMAGVKRQGAQQKQHQGRVKHSKRSSAGDSPPYGQVS